MDKIIAVIGDTISWTFDDNPTESEGFIPIKSESFIKPLPIIEMPFSPPETRAERRKKARKNKQQ